MSNSFWQRWRRVFKHRWLDDHLAHKVLPPAALQRLSERVSKSELRHSGEIRVYVEAALPLSYLLRDASARERAIAVFGKQRVWDTEHNNGVLIYLLLAERALEIVADRGINRWVSAAQWQALAQQMSEAFRASAYEQGLAQAIDAIDNLLALHFALAPGQANPNELPDVPELG